MKKQKLFEKFSKKQTKPKSNLEVQYEHVVKLEKQISDLKENLSCTNIDISKVAFNLKELTDKVAPNTGTPLPPHPDTVLNKETQKEPEPPIPDSYEPPMDRLTFLKGIVPSQIVYELDQLVIGQEEAKKALAVTVCNHIHGITNESDILIDKTNMLFMGPSGCGKTFLIQTLAKILDLPFLTVDATEFSATGYKGKDTHLILDMLVMNAGGNIEEAEKTIVFVDEVDKIANASGGGNEHFDKAVQFALLKMIEGEKYTISTGNLIDTSKMLFIFGGAFEGLFKERNKQKKNTIGFVAAKEEIEAASTPHEDLIKFGLIKEFVGRIGQVVEIESLDDETLKKIVIEPRNSIVQQYNQLFASQNIDDAVTVADVDEIVLKAKELNCGARALKSVAAAHFKDRFYR